MNNRKILLLDFDGVISPGKYFSQIYCDEFGIDIEKLNPFFEEKKQLTNVGKADLKELLKDELNNWGWNGTVDELVDYWMHADSEIDSRIVDLAKELDTSNVEIYLVTDQEKYRTEFVWNVKGLSEWLTGKFVSHEVGYEKKDKEFFAHVLSELNVREPSRVLFFDDSKSKVESAKELGINAQLYTNFEAFKKYVEENLI
jgi:FMN phosphatase YigB (HAD superfamily)